MRVAVISANLGGYEIHAEWTPQEAPAGVTVDVHRFTDMTLPPRTKAMTSKLQAGIPKWFGWQLCPGYDVYIWVDASRGLLRPDTVAWFLDRLGDQAELLAFLHPERSTIRAEYEFMKQRMARPGETYLNSRYRWEYLDEQYAVVVGDPGYTDDRLYATTAFAYRPVPRVCAALTDAWVHKTRYLLHDQLAFPYVLWKHLVWVKAIEDSVYNCPHLPVVRPSERSRRAS